jgi:hypothetical protein
MLVVTNDFSVSLTSWLTLIARKISGEEYRWSSSHTWIKNTFSMPVTPWTVRILYRAWGYGHYTVPDGTDIVPCLMVRTLHRAWRYGHCTVPDGTDIVPCLTLFCGLMNCCKIYTCASKKYTEVTSPQTVSQQGQTSLRLLVNSLSLSWPFSFVYRTSGSHFH